ncbi:hypothetical protein B0H13DRAFT_1669116 [Mycena leptocephala]|nr:hypothetical protein B0H13DRAFT_1669116 [Mycena leptocephala]
MDDIPQSSSKSLTPQRKHRKLLKDGSGTAVWPETVEAIFVEGLREYWDSPWATYSIGRSSWRNRFLVDYLQNLGITRSKKQVASHIRVLRNMWKGEPEYHLVAGGEELFQDAVKVETQELPTGLMTIEDLYDEKGSSPSNSPPEFLAEFPPSPPPGLSYSPSSPMSSIPEIESPPRIFSHLASPYSYPPNQNASPGVYPTTFVPPPIAPVRYPNRTIGLTLLADGMTAFTINLDKLAPPAPLPARTPPLALRLRLAIPPVDDSHAPANLHGFFGNVRLANVWSGQAKVFTRVYDAAGRCFFEEAESLQLNSVELGIVVAAFPNSTLSRARWLDPTVQSTIAQQIVIDGATLLFVIYELDRRASHNALPSAELIAFHKYTSNANAPLPSNPHAYPQQQSQPQPQPPQGYMSGAPASLSDTSSFPNDYGDSQVADASPASFAHPTPQTDPLLSQALAAEPPLRVKTSSGPAAVPASSSFLSGEAAESMAVPVHPEAEVSPPAADPQKLSDNADEGVVG